MTDLGAPLSSGIIACFQLIGSDAQQIVMNFNPEPQLQPFGEKPVKSFSLAPVQHLLHHRHEVQLVRQVTEQILRPLVNAERDAGITEEKFSVYDLPHKHAYLEGDGFRAHQTDLRAAIDRLNRLYVRAMDGTLAVLSDDEID